MPRSRIRRYAETRTRVAAVLAALCAGGVMKTSVLLTRRYECALNNMFVKHALREPRSG